MFESEVERIAAEKTYKNKWRDVYPLDGNVSYSFGRGNGIGYGDPLKNATISSQSDTEYTVIINYRGDINAINHFNLIPNGNSYLIDYIKTEYIE